jgi:hypothetical protein
VTGPIRPRRARPAPRIARQTARGSLAALACCLAACWTGAAAPTAAPAPAAPAAPDPAAPCPTRLVGIVQDAATHAPLADATVVVETPAGSVAAELTDARGRFETAAVRPPARLRIYHGERPVELALAACQPPLRIDVPRAP